jgi:RNA polymerase sigma-70 factor (ECF subfamily)
MSEVPLTRPSLLFRLRDGADGEAWREFVDRYGPLVFGFARRHGLQDADSADVTQMVLLEVHRGIARYQYDRQRSPFRAWLFAVARHQVCQHLKNGRRFPQDIGDADVHDHLEQQPDRESEDAAWWEQEHQWQLFHIAAQRVRVQFEDSSWQAFWQTAVEGGEPQEVAAALCMRVGSVYTAKSRVLRRLRQ